MAKRLDLDVLVECQRLKERNHYLQTRADQLTVSRDMWRERAMARWKENRSLKSKVRRLEARKMPVRRPSLPRTHSAEQWRQHDLIVKRIRAIPNRDILG